MKSRDQILSILISGAVLFLFVAGVGSAAPLQAQTVQVLSANPPSAEQGTVNLNVLIKGRGFKRGAIAKFLVTGTTDTGGVRVNSTTYVDATSLTANIDVTDLAVLSKYDIQVLNSDGRGGKGTELFLVQSKHTSTFCSPTPILTGATSCPGSYAASGCLDTSFGASGIAIANVSGHVGPDNDGATAVAIDGQGRVIVVGDATNKTTDPPDDGSTVLAAVRYLPDGQLDASFGNGGIVIVPDIVGIIGQNFAVAIQPDEKILVAGGDPMTVARLLPSDGGFDPAFGNGTGRVAISSGRAFDIAVQSDGKIVVVGDGIFRKRSVWSIARLNADGSPDYSFSGGASRKLLPNQGGIATSVALQKFVINSVPEERIVVAGSAFAILRFLPNGETDTTFGSAGVGQVVFCNGGNERIEDIAIDPVSNYIVAGGYADYKFALVRFTDKGFPDAAFGSTGKVLTKIFDNHLGGYVLEVGSGVALQRDGKIVLGGFGDNSWHYAIARYNPDGTLDSSFGQGGAAATMMGASGLKIAIQLDGKIVHVGRFRDANGAYFGVLRYWP